MNVISYAILALFWCGAALAALDTGLAKRRIRALTGRGIRAAEKTSPVRTLRAAAAARHSSRLKDELCESLSYTRNIAVLGSCSRMSAGMLLSALAGQSRLLKPVFLDMEHAINVNDRERAADVLYAVVKEPYAKDIGRILAFWEDLEPDGLLKTLEVYRNMLREERITRIRRRDELISDLIYLPVVLNCMVVLLNFLYVAYFLQQKELLQLFF